VGHAIVYVDSLLRGIMATKLKPNLRLFNKVLWSFPASSIVL